MYEPLSFRSTWETCNFHVLCPLCVTDRRGFNATICVCMARIAFVSDLIHATYIKSFKRVKINIDICVLQSTFNFFIYCHGNSAAMSPKCAFQWCNKENKNFLHNRMIKFFGADKQETFFASLERISINEFKGVDWRLKLYRK